MVSRTGNFHNQRNYWLQGLDEGFIRWAIPRLPPQINSVQLTLATLVLSALNVAVGLMAARHYQAIFLLLPILGVHHICDTLDGALGRARHEGWILWGYFMDKFVDFIYVGSLAATLILILPETAFFSLLVFLGYGGLMVASYLEFGATKTVLVRNRQGLGPTEAKVILAGLIVLAGLTGPTGLKLLIILSSLILMLFLGMTIVSVQAELAELDRKNKRAKTRRPGRLTRTGRRAKA